MGGTGPGGTWRRHHFPHPSQRESNFGHCQPVHLKSHLHSSPWRGAPLLISGRRPGLKDFHQGPVEVELEAGENLEEVCQSGGIRWDGKNHRLRGVISLIQEIICGAYDLSLRLEEKHRLDIILLEPIKAFIMISHLYQYLAYILCPCDICRVSRLTH